MDRGIKLESTSSYDQSKYESLGVVNAAMSVSVSFAQGPAPKPSGLFGSAPKPAPVDKQQRLTSTENQMLQALKKQLIMNAPPGTERLVDFKISPPQNIAHSPEYILSMLASATAIKKSPVANIAAPMPMSAAPMPMSAAPMAAPMPMAAPQALPVMPPPSAQPPAQMGGKKKSKKSKMTLRKSRKHRK